MSIVSQWVMRAAGRIVLATVLFFAGVQVACADDFSFQGYVDARLIAPPNEQSWLDGGLGKLRFGSAHGGLTARFVEAVGEASWWVTPELDTVAVIRAEPEQRTGLDALEAYARYRPVSTESWQWSVKAGAFFPPISLENDDVGWTSPYTLTPSAIDSWVGDELRTIGVEGTSQWHTALGSLTVTGAIFCCNEPAGVLMAERGWTLDDRPTGLFETLHEPSATLTLLGLQSPDRTPIFKEIDNRVGWYASAAWETAGLGHVQILYYDNDADPSAHDLDYFAWHTRFWSAGFQTRISEIAVLGQALEGSTTIAPAPSVSWTTDFWSAYLLASYDFDDWRLSARADVFGTGQSDAWWQPFGEHGHALTTALSWMPKTWLRLTAEWVGLEGERPERALVGLSKNQTDNQLQLAARFSI
jgi:hypothetical protein